MADEGNRKSKDADKNDNKERYSEKDSDDSPQHKCSQTERTSVQHMAVQWENNAIRDGDTIDTQTTDQLVQSMENNSGISDNQTANGSSLNMVNNKGPIQLGSGGTVIKNPTYNITNHHHYYPPHPDYPHGNHIVWTNHPQASLGPGSHHPGLPPPPAAQYLPVPHHTGPTDIHQAISQYPHSHHNEHTSTSTSTSQLSIPTHTGQEFPYVQPQSNPIHYGFPSPHHVEERGHPLNVNQSSSHHLPMLEQPFRHLRPGTLDPGTTPDTFPHISQRDQLQQRVASRTDTRKHAKRTDVDPEGASKRLCSSHVRHHMTTGMQARRRPVESTISRDKAKTRPVPDDVFRDTVRIIDSQGEILEPGDAVRTGNNIFDVKYVVYIGGQRIVRCVGSKSNLMVKEETLDLTSPFLKLRVYSEGPCPVFPPGRRVERAKEMIGSRLTERGLEKGLDFHYWVYTGLGFYRALDKGFRLKWN